MRSQTGILRSSASGSILKKSKAAGFCRESQIRDGHTEGQRSFRKIILFPLEQRAAWPETGFSSLENLDLLMESDLIQESDKTWHIGQKVISIDTASIRDQN
jgi:hypothetical protein